MTASKNTHMAMLAKYMASAMSVIPMLSLLHISGMQILHFAINSRPMWESAQSLHLESIKASLRNKWAICFIQAGQSYALRHMHCHYGLQVQPLGMNASCYFEWIVCEQSTAVDN